MTQNVDQGRMFRALLTDLSNAFGCLPQDINIAKLYADRFDTKALDFIYDYLRNRKQRPNTDNTYGVPQGSILIPFLF